MKVLHLSHTGLPDPRIERLAYLTKSYAEPIFVGSSTRLSQLLPNVFKSKHSIQAFNTLANIGSPVWFSLLKRDVKNIVEKIDPDVVHTHNIIAGKIAHDLQLSYVYDDHEYWSRQSLLRRMNIHSPLLKLKNRVRHFWHPRVYRKWEKEVIQSAGAVITVSEAIAAEHREQNENCHVIHNFPLSFEIEDLKKPVRHEGVIQAICLAADSEGVLEHRNAGNHQVLWEREGGIYVDWVGRAPRESWKWIRYKEWINPSVLMDVLTENYQVGLIPWTDFWYHRYSFPNKAATYSHSGLLFVLNKDFLSIIRYLPSWASFTYENEVGLLSIMREIKSMSADEVLEKRIRLKRWASKKMTLDRYSEILKNVIEGMS